MRKKILEALNTKFPGVSDSKLNRIVDNLVKKVKSEDDIQAAVDEITVESLLDSYGDARANLSRDNIIKDYETKHGLKDGKPVGNGDNGGEQKQVTTNQGGAQQQVAGGAAAGNAATGDGQLSHEMQLIMNELKSMKEQNAKLATSIATMKAEKIGSTREQLFRDLIKNLPEESQKRYLRDYGFMTFDTDDKFNAYIEAIKPDVEAEESAVKQQEARVGSPKGGGSASAAGGKVDPIVQARIDEKKAETTNPAIIGLSTNS
jgi:hypothetical protein